MKDSLPHLAVFSLGGTIASTNDSSNDGGVAPRLTATELVKAVPQLRQVASIEAVQFRQVPGGGVTLDDVVALAAELSSRFASGFEGAVVTQGTDTIEEVAFALGLLVAEANPVVVTGAMRNPTLPGADGPANLLAAAQIAASPAAHGVGCVVAFNDEIHSSWFVRKTHTTNPATFRSPSIGPIGWVTEGRPRIAVRPAVQLKISVAAGTRVPPIALLKVGIGDDTRLVDKVADLGYEGLVVEGYGGGHVPEAFSPVLARLAQRMPVVLASRTGAGELLHDTYGFSGSERDLLGRGLLPAGFLDGLKARVLLSLLLAAGVDGKAVREAFDCVTA